MKTITTKYLPPTDTKDGRVKAFDCENHSVTIPYDDDLNQGQAHRKAAQHLCDEMGWKGTLVGAGVKDGYVFCFK